MGKYVGAWEVGAMAGKSLEQGLSTHTQTHTYTCPRHEVGEQGLVQPAAIGACSHPNTLLGTITNATTR